MWERMDPAHFSVRIPTSADSSRHDAYSPSPCTSATGISHLSSGSSLSPIAPPTATSVGASSMSTANTSHSSSAPSSPSSHHDAYAGHPTERIMMARMDGGMSVSPTSLSMSNSSFATTAATRPPGPGKVTKKRTKTGCLTCRSRRIKCDEQKPHCKNCEKSKKVCDYGPKYHFRNPINSYQLHHHAPKFAYFRQSTHPNSFHHHHHHQQQQQRHRQLSLPNEAHQSYQTFPQDPSLLQAHQDQQYQEQFHLYQPEQQQQLLSQQRQDQDSLLSFQLQQQQQQQHAQFFPIPNLQHLPLVLPSNDTTTALPGPVADWAQLSEHDALLNPQFHQQQQQLSLHSQIPSQVDQLPLYLQPSSSSPQKTLYAYPTPLFLNQDTPFAVGNPEQPASIPDSISLAGSQVSFDMISPSQVGVSAHLGATVDMSQELGPSLHHQISTPLLANAEKAAALVPPQRHQHARPISYDADLGDDEDGDNEDEGYANEDINSESFTHRMTTMVAEKLSAYYHQSRKFGKLAHDTTLTNYLPDSRNSPLSDPATGAIFWHFLNVTAPSMSLFERHPFDHGDIVPGRPAPDGGHTIWTFTFPIISLHNPALLQAILSLGSLQMAKLQGIPPTAALKHYHLALRRIKKNVQSANHRSKPETLAAVLLLAYFEVWTSDHTKWCNHLCGSSILLNELDLENKTRLLLPLKRQRWYKYKASEGTGTPTPAIFLGAENLHLNVAVLNVDLLSTICGRKLNPEDCGQGEVLPQTRNCTDRDIENYEHIRDLFWWYAKMDVYQSIVAGSPLYYQYEDWIKCPPRAPLGQVQAVFGTFDHIILLLARLANFTSKDVSRKKKQAHAQAQAQAQARAQAEGSFHQTPMESASGQSSGRRNHGHGGAFSSNSPPPFTGMMPGPTKLSVTMGLVAPSVASPSDSTVDDDTDLETLTAEALKEWESIRKVFDTFKTYLHGDFEPLSTDLTDRRTSPFGRTIQHRSFGISGIWLHYYMGLIMLHRVHPSMPPAAMKAAGQAMSKTAPYAQLMGRIAAGLFGDCSKLTEINTLVGAAFIESCFCLFVAGIELQDNAQREWIIGRLLDTYRLTGWGSAYQIAEGCEAFWSKAAQLGHGRPYTRVVVRDVVTDLVNTPRRLDRRIQEVEDAESAEGGSSATQSTVSDGVRVASMGYGSGRVGTAGESSTLGGMSTATGSSTTTASRELVPGEAAHLAVGLLSWVDDFDHLNI